MRTNLRRTICMGAVVAMTITAMGVAVAQPEPDTALEHGYDQANQLLVFSVSTLDADAEDAVDCTLPTGELTVEYDAEGAISSIKQDDTEVEFSTGAGDVVTFSDGACTFAALDVTGPNGQVNHGSVVSAFARALSGGKGCLMRLIAHTAYGKDTQQVLVSEVVAPSDLVEPDSETTTGTVEFTRDLTRCNRPGGESPGQAKKAERLAEGSSAVPPGQAKKSDQPGDSPGVGNGGSDRDHSTRGKSADAPGRLKKSA